VAIHRRVRSPFRAPEQHAPSFETQDKYPPYDIARTGEDTYRVSLAVAGFSPDDITITAQQNQLTVAGRKAQSKPDHEYLYQGISAREFERRFSLEDHVEVENASFENGLLQINLVHTRSDEAAPDPDRRARGRRKNHVGQGQNYRSRSRRFVAAQRNHWIVRGGLGAHLAQATSLP
jgi:HSP20 family molecular chaperone IbpA